MPKIKKKNNKIEQCTKIFIYRDLKYTLSSLEFCSCEKTAWRNAVWLYTGFESLTSDCDTGDQLPVS